MKQNQVYYGYSHKLRIYRMSLVLRTFQESYINDLAPQFPNKKNKNKKSQ